ncbi:MAG: DUF503 domain-containing protein [Isosphaeraceae bacterium]
MTVATLRLDLRVSHCPAPRDRRRQMQAIMEKLRRHFNVAVADAEGPGGSDVSVLLVATVARSRKDARETLERVADALAAHPRAEILGQVIHEV